MLIAINQCCRYKDEKKEEIKENIIQKNNYTSECMKKVEKKFKNLQKEQEMAQRKALQKFLNSRVIKAAQFLKAVMNLPAEPEEKERGTVTIIFKILTNSIEMKRRFLLTDTYNDIYNFIYSKMSLEQIIDEEEEILTLINGIEKIANDDTKLNELAGGQKEIHLKVNWS